MSRLKSFLRRFALPALVGAALANLAVAQMLGNDDALTDWQSIGVLAAIIMAGQLLAWPLFAQLRRWAVSGLLLALALMLVGTALGALAAYVIALQIVPDSAGDYVHFGLGVGPVAAGLWLVLNFDVLRRPRAQ